MPGFTVTRGLGPGATPSSLIVRGFLAASDEAIQIIRGARRFTEKIVEELLNELKISVSLISINGKDLIKPIINTVRTSYSDEPSPSIEVRPVKLVVRQPEIKVTVKDVRSKNVDN
jgi:hypothetical protein